MLAGGHFNMVYGDITGQPSSVVFCIGSVDEPTTATFAVKSNYLLAKYQWQYLDGRVWENFSDGLGVSGSATSKLSISKPKGGWPASMNLAIRARVTEGKPISTRNRSLLSPCNRPARPNT